MQQHREAGAALDERPDRRAVEPEDQIALPVAGDGPVVGLGRPLADHHLGADELLAARLRARPRHPQRAPGPQTGDELTLERASALHVQGLVDRLVRDPHRLIIGEVDPEPICDLLWTPRLRPAPVLTATVPTTGETHSRPSRRVSRSCRRAAPARTRATRRWRRASRPSGGSRAALRATARSSRGTPSGTCAWTRCGAAPSRSSTEPASADGRSLVPRHAAREGLRSLPAQQTRDSAPRAGPTRLAASRHRRGTTGCQPARTPPPRRPRPRLTNRPQSPARIAADPHAARSTAAPATTSGHASPEPPADAREHPRRTTSITRCCDDQLNPPCEPRSEWCTSPTAGRR